VHRAAACRRRRAPLRARGQHVLDLGKAGEPWLSVYSATKATVAAFTQAMHKELGGDGIKSTALCPAFVDTPMTDFIKEQVKAEDMIQVSDIAETVRVAEDVARVRRPGDPVRAARRAALDELFVARAVAAAQPAEAEAPRLVGLALADERLVLDDGPAEVRVTALGEDRGGQVGLERSELAPGRRPRPLGASEAIPGAGEGDEARAPAAAMRGEHRAHAASAIGVRPDDDLVRADPGQHRLARAQRQAVDGQAQVFDR
jgi:hypothetical protein